MILIQGHEFKDLYKAMHYYPISGVMIKSSRKETFFDYESVLLELKDTLRGGIIIHELEGSLDSMVHDLGIIKDMLDADDALLLHYGKDALEFVKTLQGQNIMMTNIHDYKDARIALSLGVRALLIEFSLLTKDSDNPLDLLKALNQYKNQLPFKLIAGVSSKDEMNQALKAGADQILINETLFNELIK